MNKLKVKRLAVFIVLSLFMISILGGLTYAFFTGFAVSENERFGLKAGTMALTFSDGDNGINESIPFGSSITKKFVIENTGTVAASLSIDWKNLVNTYMNGSLSYNIKYSDTIDGTYTEILEESNVPTSDVPLNQTLISEVSVPAGETYYYNLTITLNNLSDKEQTSDLNANLSTEFDVGQAVPYRYYTLSIDPNGGVWEEYTEIQRYLMKNGETKNIDNPLKVGHTFKGWDINSLTSIIENKTFTMGMSNTELRAKWEVNKYSLVIDPNGGEYDGEKEIELSYGSSETISIPRKEGYTFVGWEVSGGILNGNEFTMSEDGNARLEAKWEINNYKYIVYHKKQNIDGLDYTLVEADTENKEITYGTTVTPNVRTYTGFTSPSQRSLTIQVDTDPPTKNILNYNYERNRYTLTIDPNGGTYTGNTSEEMYYEATKDLGTTVKDGYDFTNWTVTDGTMNGNSFQMGLSNATATANYTPKEYSVTFNANGGVVEEQSKTVSYDSTFGELPIPTYEGYDFLGWYTSSTGGIRISEDTKVDLNTNIVLYAHWKEIVFQIQEAITAMSNNQIPRGVKTVKPNFNIGTSIFDGYDTTKEISFTIPTDSYAHGLNADGVYIWGTFSKIYQDIAKYFYPQSSCVDDWRDYCNEYAKYDVIKLKSITADGTITGYSYNYHNVETGVYSLPDDYGTSYYYRGAVENNYLKFAGYYWRIIRVNGDGTVRISYDGTKAYKNGSPERERTPLLRMTYNHSKDAKYAGYMFGGTVGEASTSYEQATRNETDSLAKASIDSWYINNIGEEYRQYIADEIFCNDRSISTGLGYGSTATKFEVSNRVEQAGGKDPILKCPQDNDKFTVSSSRGNGALTYPVGLATIDELKVAGLVNHVSYDYYGPGSYMTKFGFQVTMSPATESWVYGYTVGSLQAHGFDHTSNSLTPVINLTSEYSKNLIGDGTMNNPYRAVGVNP